MLVLQYSLTAIVSLWHGYFVFFAHGMEGGVAVVLISSAEMQEVTRWEVQPSLDCPTTDR